MHSSWSTFCTVNHGVFQIHSKVSSPTSAPKFHSIIEFEHLNRQKANDKVIRKSVLRSGAQSVHETPFF